jgi:hypothetical protein
LQFWLVSYLKLLGLYYIYFVPLLSLCFIRAALGSFCLQLDELLLSLAIAAIKLDTKLAFGRISIAGGKKRLGCHGEVKVVQICEVITRDPFLDVFVRIVLCA